MKVATVSKIVIELTNDEAELLKGFLGNLVKKDIHTIMHGEEVEDVDELMDELYEKLEEELNDNGKE